MKNRCDEIVAALATGGAIRRWQARRHAARCPQCAGIPDQLQRATEALADVAPLTTVQRGLWIAAAGDEGPTAPTWARWFRPALTGLLAAAIAGAVGLWWMFRPVDRRPGPGAVVGVTPSVPRKPTSHDVAGLRERVVALAHELEQLRERADLLDARNDVDALMARLAPRDASNGL